MPLAGDSLRAASASRELDPGGTLEALGRVGLITFKDCKPALAEALGIPAERTGHFWGMRGSTQLEQCDILLVVGTPTLRPEDVALLARAYYYADPQLIDKSERARRGWPLALSGPADASRVANALTRADLRGIAPSCASHPRAKHQTPVKKIARCYHFCKKGFLALLITS